MSKAISWISNHDNKTLFIVLYIGLSLVLSIAISLFWLLFAVLIHLFFELIKQKVQQNGVKNIILESLWETKLDFALVVFALWLAVYLDFIFGVAGIGVAARAGAQTATRAGARFAGWNRIIRAVLLSLDDVGNAFKAFFASKRARNKDANKKTQATDGILEDVNPLKPSWIGKWGIADFIGVIMLAAFTVLIIIAPWIIGISWGKVIEIMFREFNPWPK